MNRDNFKAAVKEDLLSGTETLFRELIGEPVKANSHDWRAKGRSSFSMAMCGPNRGLWKDYSSGKGGDLFDLIAIELCGLDKAAADFPKTLATAANWVGISEDQSIDLGDLKAQQKIRATEAVKAEVVQVAHRVRLITDLQAKAQPINGTPAAVYLASRGIVNVPDTGIAYLPAASGLAVKHPHRAALVILGVADNREASGGQRVLIMPDGSKALEDTHKASFGTIQGNPARFPASLSGGPLCVAEGPESALSIWQATGFETWAVFGVSGFKGARLPHGRKVVLCPDQDAPDSPAGQQFAAAVKHHTAEGCNVWIAPAPEPEGSKHDLNDTLQRAGNAAVRDAIAAAYDARAQPKPNIPYRLKLPKGAELPDGRKETLLAAMVAAPQDHALAVALAVAQKMQLRAPVVYTPRSIAARIAAAMGDRLSAAEISAIEERLVWIQDKRRQTILARTIIDQNTAKRHDMLTVKGLDQIDSPALKGIVLIKAPMGAGKTQLVGRPFITAAKKAGGGVMAIAHRVTLIAELAHRLDLPNYQTATIQDEIKEAGGVAVCLPSITRQDIERLMPTPRFVFIDEIAQVLQFLAEDKFCRSGGGTNYGVYERLQQIVRQAETVVVADAGLDMRTIDVLEQCRPNERFRIIEMKAKPSGRIAVVYAEGAAVLDDIAIELAAGGKVWLACEGAKKAAALAARYAKRDFKVICISAETKLNAEQQAFLQDADTQSRLYDIVIASPAISSGLSIEHKESPHFTLGAYIGAGTVTRPEDAKQQLGRVRYLNRFVIGLERSNATGGQTVTAIRKGSERAAQIEGLELPWTGFDDFVAQIKVDAANARVEFSAGLWFLLEADGWTIERPQLIENGAARKDMRSITYEHKAARIDAILSAPLMDSHQASLTERMARNTDQETGFIAHTIRITLGKLDLTAQDVEFWDDGRGLKRIAFFEDMTQTETDQIFESGQLTQRPFRLARRRLYAVLFDGINLQLTITPDMVEIIIDRIMVQPEAYAAVGIVGPKYRAQYRGTNGVLTVVKRPKKPNQELKEILEKCGLKANLQRKRFVPNGALSLDKRGPSGTATERGYVLTVTPDSWTYMTEILARRGTFNIDDARACADHAVLAHPFH